MKNVDYCTGCSACAEKCIYGAITMKYDCEGFLYPEIDANKCIKCGICDVTCAKYDNILKINPIESFSVYAKSSIKRENGSSGGVFGVIANKILSEGGVVFGAIFSSEEKKVFHVSTDGASLAKLMRSKYVQSDTCHTFSEVKKLLKQGKKVFYVGTPCEIIGLKSFLGKESENLLTMDFMCHGVPSPMLFKDTLSYYEKKIGSKITDFTFREKKLGWRKQSVNIYFENGKILTKKSTNFYYYYYFLQNYTLRKSCFECELYKKHLSDLTVADYWTVPRNKDDDKGISLVFINSEKGKLIFNDLQKCFVTEPYIENNLERFSHRKYVKKNREDFFFYYCKYGGEKTIKKYRRRMYYNRVTNQLKNSIQNIYFRLLKYVEDI